MQSVWSPAFEKPATRYGWTLGIVALAFLLRQCLVHLLGQQVPPFLTFYPAVMIVAILAGLWPGVLATLLSAILAEYGVFPPSGGFSRLSSADLAGVLFFTVMGVMISAVVDRYSRSQRSLAASESEEALRASNVRLDLALDAAGLGEWELDLKTKIATRSLRHSQIFGYSALTPGWSEEMFAQHILPEHRAAVAEKIAAASQTGFLDFETKIRRADGEVRWIWVRGRHSLDKDGTPVQMHGTVMDITQRKESEAALQTSEAHLRLFVEYAPAALAMFDRDMRYIRASRRWLIDSGLGEREVRGLCQYDLFPDIPGNRRDAICRGLAGEVVKNECDVLDRADGTSRWIRWEIRPWQDATGGIGGILFFAEDITERMITEKKLQRLSRTYAVLSNINQTIVRERNSQHVLETVCTIAVEKGNFRMAWIGMIDASNECLVPVASGGVVEDYRDDFSLTLRDAATCQAPTARCLTTGLRAVSNDIANDPDFAAWRDKALEAGFAAKASLPLKIHGKLAGVLNLYAGEPGFFDDEELRLLDEMAMDISYALEVDQNEAARRKAEEELRWRTAFFEAQMESSLTGIMVKDDSGKVIFQNQRFAKLWKMPPEIAHDREGQQQVEFLVAHTKNPEEMIANTLAMHVNPERPTHDVLELLDGTTLNLFTSPVRDDDGRNYGRLWVFQDITEQRQLEQQLRHAQKMEAVGQLTGGIAHDFNNLLGVIIGNLDLLALRVQGDDVAVRRVLAAQKAAERGADVTRRLLSFSRSGELRPRPTFLHHSVQEVIDLARTIGPDISFINQTDASVPPVFVDAAGLESALLNLIVNARDAMPDGGSLTIATCLVTLEENYPPVQIGELKPGAHACITISDTGQGIAEETLNRVFEPFFTTKGLGQGTGLGLAMVYGFVKQSSGSVRIASKVGEGTTITIHLPIAGQSAAAEMPLADAALPSVVKVAKVLVVDDEPDLIEISEAYLETMGYTVYTAADAAGALEIARQHPDIDLMVTDILMPGGMNGVELARNIRVLIPHIKIIYSSGFPANAMATRGMAPLDGPMLHKPYHSAEFEAAIQLALGK